MFGTHAPDFGAASDGMSGPRLLLCFHVLSIGYAQNSMFLLMQWKVVSSR